MTELGFTSKILTKFGAIMDQQYQGDITIVPDIPFSWYPFIISNPKTPMVASFTVMGEKATWPSTFSYNLLIELSKIRNSCRIELLLDDLIRHLRRQTFRRQSVQDGQEIRLDSSFNGNMDFSDSSDDLKLTPRNKGIRRAHINRSKTMLLSPESIELQ
jgi:hypothetical protein